MTIEKIFIASEKKNFESDVKELEGFFLRLNNAYIKKDLYFSPIFNGDVDDQIGINREIAESRIAVFLTVLRADDELQQTYEAAHASYNESGKPRIVVYTKQGIRDVNRRTGDSNRRTADGDRRIWNGDRRVWDGSRRVCEGSRRTADGDRRTWDGSRRVWDGDRRIDSDRRTDDDRRTADDDRRTWDGDRRADDNRRTDDSDRRTDNNDRRADDDRRTDNNDRRTDNNDRRTDDSDRRTYNNDRRTDDDRRTDNGDRRTADDRRTDNGDRRKDDDRRTSNDDRRTSNSDRRTSNSDRRTSNSDRRTNDDDRRTNDNDRRTGNSDRRTGNGDRRTNDGDRRTNDGDRRTNDGDRRTGDVDNGEQALSIKHSAFYNSTYSHVDTLKLGILMQINQLGLSGVDIRLDGGKAWQGGEVLMTLDNVEALTGYENLQELKQKRAILENRFYAAKARFAENPDDAAAYEEFHEASKLRGDAMQEIRDIESQLYHMIEGMYEHTAQGKLSARQAEAYKLIERGLLSEARDVLDFYAIVNETRRDEEVVDQAAKRAKINIKELMQLKDLNAALLDWEGVEACFREAMRLEEKFNLPRLTALNPIEYDYLEYLVAHRRHEEAVDICDHLLGYFNSEKTGIFDEQISLIYNYLGQIYTNTNQMTKAEEVLKASLALRQARTDGDPNINLKDVAVVYNNLGNLYSDLHRFDEATDALLAMLEICKKLVGHDPEAFTKYLAYASLNLSELYNEMECYDKSVIIAAEARDLFIGLVPGNPDLNEQLSCTYENLGVALSKAGRFDEALEQFDIAYKMQLGFAENNPDVYEPRVAECAADFGRSFFEAKRYSEAEEKYKESIKLYKRLISRDPDAYETGLAKCSYNMGMLYITTEHPAEAEEALNTALRIFNKYGETNRAFVERAEQTKKLLSSYNSAPNIPERASSEFTFEEKEVALLLTEGLTQREIARKLGISAVEVARRVSSVREKVSGKAGTDPVIEAVTHEYKLTRREAEMLLYLHSSAGTDIIASELYLSPETVKIHVRNLLKKLSIESRHGVTDWLDSYSKKE